MGGIEFRGNDSEFGVEHVKFEMPLLTGDIKEAAEYMSLDFRGQRSLGWR